MKNAIISSSIFILSFVYNFNLKLISHLVTHFSFMLIYEKSPLYNTYPTKMLVVTGALYSAIIKRPTMMYPL